MVNKGYLSSNHQAVDYYIRTGQIDPAKGYGGTVPLSEVPAYQEWQKGELIIAPYESSEIHGFVGGTAVMGTTKTILDGWYCPNCSKTHSPYINTCPISK